MRYVIIRSTERVCILYAHSSIPLRNDIVLEGGNEMHSPFIRASHAAGIVVLISLVMVVVASGSANAAKLSAVDYQNNMRQLWDDHITYTRLYIESVAGNLPDKDITAQRLLENQTEIANAIRPFLGDAAGDKLESLLKEHIMGAATVLDEARSGDKAKLKVAKADWYSNANDIAVFISSADPKVWPLRDMKRMMKEHLDQTLEEASAYLNGDYSTGIADFDKAKEHMLMFADTLSTGIVTDFPKKFESTSICVAPKYKSSAPSDESMYDIDH
jgi:hypothetical protein